MHTTGPHSANYQHPPIDHSTLQNADWSALRLLNHYRFLLLLAFAAVFYLTDNTTTLGQLNPTLFKIAHIAYLLLAFVSSATIGLRRPDMETQFYLQAYVDMIALATLIHASGGIQSGLAILLVFQIAVIGHCARGRYAMLFAAIATALLLAQELYTQFTYGAALVDFPQTALVCLMLFFVTFLISVVLPRQTGNKQADNRPLNVKQIAELNNQIIQELESGVLYIDNNHHIQLVNDTAREMIQLTGTTLPLHLGLACEPLYIALKDWCAQPDSGNRPITTQSTNQELLPHFTSIENGGTLIKIEDHLLIKQQVQQLKLASLGRLSASIAHEIRNPLGAISNAVQLLGESDKLTPADARLINIAENHTHRINRIIEDVLHLSSRQKACAEQLDIQTVLENFKDRFIKQNALNPDTINVATGEPVFILFDPLHLDQILWNLCRNSLVHNDSGELKIVLACSTDSNASLQLDVADNGKGIDPAEQDNVFEPFYTTSHAGTGLGLFIIRELCELNHASIKYLHRGTGACFRVTLPIARQMAA